jgi:WD40 repeat protein
MAWHPHHDILALAHDDNQVYIYEKARDSTVWSCKVLAHALMKDVTCLAWKSKTVGLLAVGCADGGVCVWTVPALPQSTDQQPMYHPTATMRHLTYQDSQGVSSLAWDPTPGSHLLAVVSAHSSTLVIHDILLDRTIPLKRYGKGSVLLRWSPNGQWLFEGGA